MALRHDNRGLNSGLLSGHQRSCHQRQCQPFRAGHESQKSEQPSEMEPQDEAKTSATDELLPRQQGQQSTIVNEGNTHIVVIIIGERESCHACDDGIRHGGDGWVECGRVRQRRKGECAFC